MTMTGKWIYAGAIALMALCTEQAAAQQEIVLTMLMERK